MFHAEQSKPQATVLPKKNAEVLQCFTHCLSSHDFYFNYGTTLEDQASDCSSESKRVVQAVYEKLSVQRKQGELPVFVFWDEKCLNLGEKWENTFFHWITSSSIIILLVSKKVLKMMSQNAVDGKQDNVLVEYECALLRHATSNVPVFCLLLPEINMDRYDGDNEKAVEFDFMTAASSLPDVQHKRGSIAQKAVDCLREKLASNQTEFLQSVSKTVEQITKLPHVQFTSHTDVKEVNALISILMGYLPK